MMYRVNTAIRHKGRTCPAGSVVEMSEAAARVLRPGTVVPVEDGAGETKPADTRKAAAEQTQVPLKEETAEAGKTAAEPSVKGQTNKAPATPVKKGKGKS